jgi:cell division protein ZapA
MGAITVNIGGRAYSLACRDGEEPRLIQLASHLSYKADELTESLGQMSEPRLLLMAGILVTDELFDLRAAPRNGAPAAPSAGAQIGEALTRLAERVERLAESLETAVDNS